MNDRALGLYRWTFANRRAANDYAATPTEFADRRYCSKCSRIPAKKNGCKTCWERVDKREKKAAIDRAS